MRILYLISTLAALSGCAITSPFTNQTLSEQESGYTYVPIDPFAVQTVPGGSCPDKYQTTNLNLAGESSDIPFKPLLESLPDNAVRISIEQFKASGSINYGPAGLGAKGESYRVTVDYINADTTNFPVWISKRARPFYGTVGSLEAVPMLSKLPDDFQPGTEVYEVTRIPPSDDVSSSYVEFNIPVYVGIGLRVTANVDVIGSKANISGLGAIGAEAEAENLKGSLVVQTLGVNGKSIAAALPIQSELNRSTAQSAVVAVGSIKALLYEDETVVSPRVVGIYLPFPGGKPLVNAIISELSKERVLWQRPCNTI